MISLFLPGLAVLSGCGGGGSDTGETPDLCTDAPVVTWDNFGDGFVTESCQTCHASTSEDRNGAPVSVVFDTREEALNQSDLILTVVVDESTMPPQGGISDDDRLLVSYWLICWE